VYASPARPGASAASAGRCNWRGSARIFDRTTNINGGRAGARRDCVRVAGSGHVYRRRTGRSIRSTASNWRMPCVVCTRIYDGISPRVHSGHGASRARRKSHASSGGCLLDRPLLSRARRVHSALGRVGNRPYRANVQCRAWRVHARLHHSVCVSGVPTCRTVCSQKKRAWPGG